MQVARSSLFAHVEERGYLRGMEDEVLAEGLPLNEMLTNLVVDHNRREGKLGDLCQRTIYLKLVFFKDWHPSLIT